MLEKIKSLSRQTLVYGTGHILARLVTFLLLPLYTNVFTPSEYGVISLAYTFIGFMVVVLHYGLDASLMKHYVQAEKEERAEILTSAYISYFISSLVFFLLMVLLRQFLAVPLLGIDRPDFIIIIGAILAFDILWSVAMLIFRAEERPSLFITTSLTNVLLTMALNIVLVAVLNMGMKGVLISNLVVSAFIFLVTLPVLIKRMSLKSSSFLRWRNMMEFGLPFLPSGIFAMIMDMAGRYMLSWMSDLETVGIFSAGYKLGMLMFLVVMGFNMGWQPFFLKEERQQGKEKLFARIGTYVFAVLGLLWVLLLLWVEDIVRLRIGSITLYGPAYWRSVVIVPIIALGYVFHAGYMLQLPGVFYNSKSMWVAVARGIGAATVIILNLFFIPAMGATGAAISYMFASGAMMVTIYLINRMLMPIPFEWTRLARIIITVLLIYLLSVYLEISLLTKILLSLAYPLILAMLGFFSKREWNVVFSVFGRRRL